MNYEELLNTTTLNDQRPEEALTLLGTLIDLAHERRDEKGATHAIKLAEEFPLETWSSRDRAILKYFLSNAWSDVRNIQSPRSWEWTTNRSSDHCSCFGKRETNRSSTNCYQIDGARSLRISATA